MMGKKKRVLNIAVLDQATLDMLKASKVASKHNLTLLDPGDIDMVLGREAYRTYAELLAYTEMLIRTKEAS
jgi:hypothetical protein